MSAWVVPLFADPFADLLGSALAFVTVVCASTGGLGGGGLLVPLYMLVLHLGRFAIPLSNATIFGASIANVLLNWRRRHPEADRPLIAFDVALMLEPITLAGTVVGVTLNAIFPQWLVTILLVVLLGVTARKTLSKAISTYRKETNLSVEEVREGMPISAPDPTSSKLQKARLAVAELRALDDSQVAPWILWVLSGCWVFLFVMSIVKGG